MNKVVKLTLISVLFFLYSCATSMTPVEVYNTLPSLTKSQFVTQSQAEEAMQTKECKYLVKGRSYLAPIGFSTTNDLRNGAKGIDEWVKLDGGNAYVLTNYKWITVDNSGSTQLFIEFDTLKCNSIL